jgi:hypothetical protein
MSRTSKLVCMKSIHKRKDLVGRKCFAWFANGNMINGRIREKGIQDLSTEFLHDFSEFQDVELETKPRHFQT